MEQKLEVRITVNGVMNVGDWLGNDTAPQLMNSTRNIFLRSKKNQERLSAALLSAVASFTSKKIWIPAFVDDENSAVDAVVIDKSGSGADVQVVSVKPQNHDITEEVWTAIKRKHNKGKNYGEHIHLVVFSLNQHYKINLEILLKRLKDNNIFWSYWLIAPYGNSKNCIFIVNHIFGEDIDRPYQYTVDFTPPKSLRIGFFRNFLKGDTLITLSDFLKS